eukprot:5815112-Pyramimonas_sp.AAC.2
MTQSVFVVTVQASSTFRISSRKAWQRCQSPRVIAERSSCGEMTHICSPPSSVWGPPSHGLHRNSPSEGVRCPRWELERSVHHREWSKFANCSAVTSVLALSKCSILRTISAEAFQLVGPFVGLALV